MHGGKGGALAAGLASGISETKVLSKFTHPGGGRLVELVTFNDGSQAVRKTGDDVDQEQLGTLVGHAVGAPVPEVLRDGDAVYLSYVEGDLGAHRRGEVDFDSPEARLIGMSDVMIANYDRHGGNFMVGDDGRLYGIDHGHSWDRRADRDEDGSILPPQGMLGGEGAGGFVANPFVRRFIDPGVIQMPGKGLGGRVDAWSLRNPTSYAQAQRIRARLKDLKSTFAELGHPDWYDETVERFEAIVERGRG